MPFTGKLIYDRMLDGEESFAGRPLFRLAEEFSYTNDKVKKDFVVRCEKGYVTDFASIPEWIPMNARGTLWKRSAVIHDKACNLAKIDVLTHREANAYLYYALRDDGATKFTATFFWLAATIFHYLKGDL